MFPLLKKLLMPLVVLATTAAFVTPSQAVPAFARQTGKACATCHFQHYPTLNDYGRDFKANGYTAQGKQGTVKGTKDNELSIPDVLNASVFLKTRYQKTNGTDANPAAPTTNSGQWQAPDEFALLFGGRVTSNIGFLLEAQLIDPAAGTIAGFKMPMMYDVAGKKMGVIPFTTDALGVAYGFELMNTGSVRNVRVFEDRKTSSAQQYLGTDGAAFGAAFVVYDPTWHVNFSRWGRNHNAMGAGNVSTAPDANYLRAAYTPTLGDWDTAVGVQLWRGSPRDDTGALVDTNATSIDAQAQGVVGGKPLGLYFTHASVPDDANTVFKRNSSATTFAAEYGIIPNKATLMFAFRNATANGTADNSWMIGGTYQLAQNVTFQLQHTTNTSVTAAAKATGGDTNTIFMLSAGF